VAERPNTAAGWLPVAPQRKRLLLRYLFRVWNSFLVCPPLTARGYFAATIPSKRGISKLTESRVAVAAGTNTRPGQEIGAGRLVSQLWYRIFSGSSRPASYAMLCLRDRCGVSCHKRCPFGAGCAVGSLTAIQKEATARSGSTSGTPNYPCATLVGGLPVSVGCCPPPITGGRYSGEFEPCNPRTIKQREVGY